MASTSKVEIVENLYLFTSDYVLALEFTETSIRNYFTSKYAANQFLAKVRIIKNKQRCEQCEESPNLSYIKSTQNLDGYI
jgi:hypothetical protein